jgi:hypothetical protein
LVRLSNNRDKIQATQALSPPISSVVSDKSATSICYNSARKKSPVHISICAGLNMI